MSIYRQIRNLSRDEQLALLVSKGMTEDQAEDWLTSYLQTANQVGVKDPGPRFTESEQWREIQRRVERLKSEKLHEMRGSPPRMEGENTV